MKNLYLKRVQRRSSILVVFFILWFGVLIFRLIQLQVINHTQLKAIVANQNQDKDPIIPERGTIFDRSGNILARSIPCQSVFLTPFEKDAQEFQKLNKLRNILRLTSSEVRRIQSRIKKNEPFIWIKRKVDLDTAEKVRNLGLNGVHLREERKRFYPHGKLAGHVLGRVNIDDVGMSGVEYRYDPILGGQPGERLNLRDAKKKVYRFEILKNPKPGKDIILTIDETIQYYAARELQKAVRKTKANWGTVIISHPPSGEILAMANYPEFDLNHPPAKVDLIERNKAIHHTSDPGSTFKIITASAALESERVDLDDTFDCSDGFRQIAGKTIRDHKKFETLTFSQVIVHSSNVGATLISEKIGEEILYKTIKSFGFGKKTGIDLPAEEKGIFRPVSRWSALSYASLAIGYEIAVTPIQMLQAVNIIANRGVFIHPKVVKEIYQAEAKEIDTIPTLTRVLSEKTALTLTEILEDAVRIGTGEKAQIQGFRVAGKTGTAQKIDQNTGTYTSKAHMASFTGFVPVDTPLLSIIVVIDEPKYEFYGGDVAAPVFHDIAALTLRYLRSQMKKLESKPLTTATLWRAGT